ncbi:hypothetical protein [Dokdonella immobilis]|uniref:hypothetical protein n=1 Tax=Dokdonella immobilis TaxID=578942 RepID=UPI001113A8A3|nr:hypothetical protein [Dokdonella immobilis]
MSFANRRESACMIRAGNWQVAVSEHVSFGLHFAAWRSFQGLARTIGAVPVADRARILNVSDDGVLSLTPIRRRQGAARPGFGSPLRPRLARPVAMDAHDTAQSKVKRLSWPSRWQATQRSASVSNPSLDCPCVESSPQRPSVMSSPS